MLALGLLSLTLKTAGRDGSVTKRTHYDSYRRSGGRTNARMDDLIRTDSHTRADDDLKWESNPGFSHRWTGICASILHRAGNTFSARPSLVRE
jgi:hypothetical protein